MAIFRSSRLTDPIISDVYGVMVPGHNWRSSSSPYQYGTAGGLANRLAQSPQWSGKWYPFGDEGSGQQASLQDNALSAMLGYAQKGGKKATGYYKPYRQAGKESVNTLLERMRAGPGEFETSPGYQFRLKEGVDAVQRSAAARNQLQSGPTLKAIDQYSQGLASDEYQNWLNQYYQSLAPWQDLTGKGLTAAAGSSQAALAQMAGELGAHQTYLASMMEQGRLDQGAAEFAMQMELQRQQQDLQKQLYDRLYGGF